MVNNFKKMQMRFLVAVMDRIHEFFPKMASGSDNLHSGPTSDIIVESSYPQKEHGSENPIIEMVCNTFQR